MAALLLRCKLCCVLRPCQPFFSKLHFSNLRATLSGRIEACHNFSTDSNKLRTKYGNTFALPRHDVKELKLAVGQVIRTSSYQFYVDIDEVDPLDEAAKHIKLPKRLLCTVRSLLRKMKKYILVGDRVTVSNVNWVTGQAVIEEVVDRKSELIDPAVANVDHILLVFAADAPPFEPAQVSRFLVSMEGSGIPFNLVLNKVDLLPAKRIQEIVNLVRSWGYEPMLVSCTKGIGLEQLHDVLAGKTSVMAGPSGCGKSSLINALRLGKHKLEEAEEEERWQQGLGMHEGESDEDGEEDYGEEDEEGEEEEEKTDNDWGLPKAVADLIPNERKEFVAVGDVSKYGRGKHTTTYVTLLNLPFGGRMVDTPGFSLPTLDKISPHELANCFPEMAMILKNRQCRFKNCFHLAEPGCVINSAGLHRYVHYMKLLDEIRAREDLDRHLLNTSKMRRQGVAKLKTAKRGVKRLEVLLSKRDKKPRTRKRHEDSVPDD